MEKIDFTRLKTLQTCPKKHDYIYNEKIRGNGGKYATVGRIFHACLEGFYLEDHDIIDKNIKEYEDLVRVGRLDAEPGLIEYCFAKYTQFYADKDKDETVLAVEKEFVDPIDETDEFYLRIDRLVQNNKTGMITLRDTKTTLNKLKYTYDDVNYNTQLLTYVPFIEDEMKVKVDVIEIDEVRLAKLQPVPFNANGKPTGDRHRLELTTYEDYMDVLEEMELVDDKAYAGAIQYMEKRGHPLFNRISAQILDPLIVSANMKDMFNTYQALKQNPTFRIKGILCNYCEYKNLCRLDMYNSSDALREIEVNKILTSA